MTIKLNIFWIIGILAVLSIFMYVVRGKYHSDINNANTALYEAQRALFNDSIRYNIIIDGLRYNISEERAIVISSQRALKQSEIEKERLKKLKMKDVIAISDLNLAIDSLKEELSLVETEIITIYKDSIPSDFMRLPIDASFNDLYTHLNVSITKDTSLFILSQNIPIVGVIGTKKTSLFKSEVYSTIDCPVPYVNINKNNSLVIIENKRFYEKPLVLFGVGFASALLLTAF